MEIRQTVRLRAVASPESASPKRHARPLSPPPMLPRQASAVLSARNQPIRNARQDVASMDSARLTTSAGHPHNAPTWARIAPRRRFNNATRAAASKDDVHQWTFVLPRDKAKDTAPRVQRLQRSGALPTAASTAPAPRRSNASARKPRHSLPCSPSKSIQVTSQVASVTIRELPAPASRALANTCSFAENVFLRPRNSGARLRR